MRWRGSAVGVGREEDAFSERIHLNGAPGVDERAKRRRGKRGRISASRIRRARGAMLRVLEVTDEIVVGERREDEHRRIQRDAEPFHDRHEVLDHLPSKDNPDSAGNTAQIGLTHLL